jgi:tetratricopeptide (TPR) repeat protein
MSAERTEDVEYEGTGELEQVLAHGWRLLSRDPRAAAAQAREILRVNPVQGDALRLLARALRVLGRTHEAEQAEVAAIKASAHVPVLVQAARALTEDRLHEAEHLLRPYLARNPSDAAATRMLAEIAARVGDLASAEQLLRRALELAPAYAAARLRLARMLLARNRPAESLKVLDSLLSAEPDNPAATGSKAAALGSIGEYGEALALYERLLSQNPDEPGVWMSYGHLLHTVGRGEESLAAYRRAIAIDPAFGEAWWSIANVKTARLDERDIALMTQALEQPELDETKQLHIHFALGKAHEDARDYEQSFRNYAAGNALRRDDIGYDADLHDDLVRRCRSTFSAQLFAARAGTGSPAADPIFIVGMPRAGSTLIEQILASHSLVEGTAELPYLPSMVQRLAAESEAKDGPAYPEIAAALEPDALRALGEEYLESARVHRKSRRPHFIDKLPNNWINTGFIQLILPNARIIDARRDPLDCCFSNFKQNYARGQGFSYGLEDLGRYYRSYVEFMRHVDSVLPGRVHRVIHERLVDDTEAEIRRLLDYLGLPFEESCLRFYENDRAVRTPSAEQVRRPINREGVGKWKPFEPWLEPLKRALGPVLDQYPDVPEAPARAG